MKEGASGPRLSLVVLAVSKTRLSDLEVYSPGLLGLCPSGPDSELSLGELSLSLSAASMSLRNGRP